MKIGWSSNLRVLDAGDAALAQIRGLDASDAAWVLIEQRRSRACDPTVYVLSRAEFFQCLRQTEVPFDPATRATLDEVFRLQELAPSRLVRGASRPDAVQPQDVPAFSVADVLSGWRCANLSDDGSWLVGGPDVDRHAMAGSARPSVTRGGSAHRAPAAMPSAPFPLPAQPAPPLRPPVGASRPAPAGSAPPEAAGDAPEMLGSAPDAEDAAADEGTRPLRYPSIEPEGALQPGAPLTLRIDLRRQESEDTVGSTALPEMAADWSVFDVEVAVSSPHIDFDADGRAVLQVRRNADSVPARLSGRVRAGLPPGHTLQVKARFLVDSRLCGSAARLLSLADAPAPVPAAAPENAPPAVVQIDPAAASPDLTVEICIADPDKPTRLAWSMWTRPFPGRPPKLTGAIQLGQRPDVEASALFARFATLQRGEHQEAIEGFGEELWAKSPPEFQALYWALCDHLQRPLTIQFITDDPHMPWELMNPHRPGTQHGTLALRHAVARWLLSYKGYLENRLPKGRLVAMAPRYPGGNELRLAEAATQALVDKFRNGPQVQAERVEGKRAELLKLLEAPAPARVALLFFNGHGAFSSDTASASRLKLEDGSELTPMEVKRQKVMLGERDGTVVFLNACEVGATGSVLGNVGGWADAFLAREFRAFIAPLWAIDEEDGTQVTAELMDAIVTRQQPLGEALRDLRARHGAVSPTFYSYLLYGDVTARLGTG